MCEDFCTDHKGQDHLSDPEYQVLRAVFAHLREMGFTPWWTGMDHFLVGGVPGCNGNGRFTFFKGDLAIVGSKPGMKFLFTNVVCRFDMADPRLFDQVVGAVKSHV